MKILITGGGGYLGAVLVSMLLNARHTVTVVDTFMHGVPSLAAHAHRKRLTILRQDARIAPPVQDHDAIIPLAAIVGAPACDRDPLGAVTTNQAAIEDLVWSARLDQIIIFPCTNSGYGLGGGTECTEDSPLTPISLYGRTKVEAECIVLKHPRGISLRLATLFGCSPRMRLDLMVNDFCYRAVRDRAVVLFESHFRRNFVHVQDAAYAFLFALNHAPQMVGRAHNIGDSRANMTKLQLAQAIAAEVPEFVWTNAAQAEDPDKRDYIVSNARIEALGWRPQFTLQDGIHELVSAFSGMPFESQQWRNV